MEIRLAQFRREARRRIEETFPRNRLPFYQSLRPRAAFSAFQKINRVPGDEEKAWHLFLVALHVLYEGWHDLPPLSVGQRKSLRRDAQALRAIAGRLRVRGVMIEVGKEPDVLEKIAAQLERVVQPSTERLYNAKLPGGRRIDPREAIPIFGLATLFRQRLSDVGVFPVIVDFMNALPVHPKKYNVGTIKKKLAQLEGVGFQPRVQFMYDDHDVVTLKFRDAPTLGPVQVSR